MANQTLPVVLTWGPFAGSFIANDINELGALIARQLSGEIRADVSFVLVTANDPATFITQLIFNSTQNVFKSWSTTAGAYMAVTQFAVGDVKNSFVGVDSVATGWVVLNGRVITAITGLSGAQQTALQQLFGTAPTQTIPSVTPANVNGLPANGSFSNIPWPPSLNPVLQPPADTFGNLTFSNPVADTEAKALADQTEILRDSSQSAFTVTKQIQAQAEFLLEALNNNTTPPLYALLFVGFP